MKTKKKRPFSSAKWKKINGRRIQLIAKKFSKPDPTHSGLTKEEERELEGLQKQAECYLETLAPLDIPRLRQLKKAEALLA